MNKQIKISRIFPSATEKGDSGPEEEVWRQALSGFHRFLLLERGLSLHSQEAYLRDGVRLAQYALGLDPPRKPSGLILQDLEGFLKVLNEVGLAVTSQARVLSGIKAFYRYLILESLIDQDPSSLLQGPVQVRTIPDVLDVEEVEALMAAVDLSAPSGQRDRAMLEVLYACGLRVSELVGLKLTHLYLDAGFLRVIGKNNKERLVPIGTEAVRHLRFYLDDVRRHVHPVRPGDENVVFLNQRGGRLSRVMVFQLIRRLAEAAGIRKTVSPHTFRHTFATHLVEGGADLRAVQEMLGHASITTTEIYTHLDMRYLRETVLRYHPANQVPAERQGDE